MIKLGKSFYLLFYYVIGLLLSGCESSATHDYFPLQSGLNWRYKMSYETMDGPAESYYVMESLPVKKVDGEEIFTRKALDGRLFHYKRKEDGLILTDHEITIGNERKLWESNQFVFKYPVELGKTWQGQSRTRVLIKTGPPQKTEFRIVASIPVTHEITSVTDTVTVPAGTFENCVRVNLEGSGFYNAGNYVGKTILSINESNWYAPGVGLVKSLREETTTSKSFDMGTMVLVLEKFSQN